MHFRLGEACAQANPFCPNRLGRDTRRQGSACPAGPKHSILRLRLRSAVRRGEVFSRYPAAEPLVPTQTPFHRVTVIMLLATQACF